MEPAPPHDGRAHPGFVLALCVTAALIAATEPSERFCYVCSGMDCMENPYNPELSPGRIQCHPVDDYCVTHIQYLVKNESFVSGKPLGPEDYTLDSATRSCAKTYLGNLCRRDFLGRPHITCITTCAEDYCNCHARSPPPEMFVAGKPLYESPRRSTHPASDVDPCLAAQRSRDADLAEQSRKQAETQTTESVNRGRARSRFRGPARSRVRGGATAAAGDVILTASGAMTGLCMLTWH